MKEGDHEAAIQTGIRLLALDPLQESVHRTLMTIYARTDAEMPRRVSTTAAWRSWNANSASSRSRKPRISTTDPAGSAALRRFVESGDPGGGRRPRHTCSNRGVPHQRRIRGQPREDGRGCTDSARPPALRCSSSRYQRSDARRSEILEISDKQIETPAIFLTCASDNELETRGFELGAADFIRKRYRRTCCCGGISDVCGKQARSGCWTRRQERTNRC